MTVLYGDETTRKLVAAGAPITYLYGSWEGYENYGDVLQLKSVIRYYRELRDRAVVLVLSLSAWSRDGFLDELVTKYDADGLLFEDDEYLATSRQGLDVVREVAAGQFFHLYGGGYFNRFWGERRGIVTANLLEMLGIERYVVSGLQIDESGAEFLRRLFAIHPPLLVGGRDLASTELLRSVAPGVPVEFSFDDAIESILALRDGLGLAPPTPGGTATVGLHLNITGQYMSSEQGPALREALAAVDRHYPAHELTLIHAYNDRRDFLFDTLESAKALGIVADYPTFEVVNFGTVSASKVHDALMLERLAEALAPIDFVVSASYHVAMTMNLLGRPAYLLATNDYYRDKRSALGLPTDIDAFLDDPSAFLRDFSQEQRARTRWIELLGRIATTEVASSGRVKFRKPLRPPRRDLASKHYISG